MHPEPTRSAYNRCMARLTVEFPDRTNGVLEQLAAQQGTTKTDILRRAIVSYHILSEAIEKGSEIRIVDEAAGTQTRLVLT